VTDVPASLGLREIDDAIFASPEDANPTSVHYDRMGRLYDVVCGTRAYNRAVWGTTPDRSRTFATRIFESHAAGPHVEVGCGGLLFTSHLYDEDRGRLCVLSDPSIVMLRMARGRLRKRYGEVPSHVVLVRADGLRSPLPAGFATTVLSMHVVHVLDARADFLRALGRLASADSTIGFSSLVRTGHVRDHLLTTLYRAGELSRPFGADELTDLARATLPGVMDVDARGSMRFITIRTVSRSTSDASSRRANRSD
jgi:SAM-dependent methyltransferase